MTRTTILEEQTLEGFAYSDAYGCYYKSLNPAPFSLMAGETYRVVWDGNEYESTAYEYAYGQYTVVGIGNKLASSGENTGEPFAASYNAEYETLEFYSLASGTSHTAAIYQGEEPGVILKNRDGEDREYYGMEAVKLVTTNGGTQLFSKGEAVENIEIVPDFSAGDAVFKAAAGQLIKSAIIKKPSGLGGDGSSAVTAGGTVRGVTSGATVSHRLGVVPDLILVYRSGTAANFMIYAHLSTGLQSKLGWNAQQLAIQAGSSAISTITGLPLFIHSITAESFTAGTSGYPMDVADYQWLAIGGLT